MSDFHSDIEGNATTGEDARQAERAALMMRHAKVVCQSGQYLCMIRDVSELGVGLVFLHEVPPEERIILQLANDHTYPIERVWCGKRQSGYRFGCEMDVEEFIEEQSAHEKRALRVKSSGEVRIVEGRTTTTGQLLDLSCEGAKFAADTKHVPQRLLSFEVDGLPPQLGQIRWQEGGCFGVKFQHPLSAEELAACLLHLQPYAQSEPCEYTSLLSKACAA